MRVLRAVFVSIFAVGASAFACSIAPAASAGATSVGASVPRLVQFTGATVNTPATATTATFPTTTGAGDLLVVSASLYTGTTNRITSVTDPSGNVWTKVGAYASSSHYSDGEMWYSANSRSTTSVTVHTAKSVLVAFAVQEFAGVLATSPLDGASGTSGFDKAPDSGSVAPSQSGDLVVGFLAGHSGAQTMTVSAPGYVTQSQQTSRSGGSSIASVVVASRVASLNSAQNLTGSFGTAMYWAAGVAVFKPAASDFAMNAAPAAVTAISGRAATTTISTTTTAGPSQSVALTVSGLPAGTSAWFDPATITSGQTSTLTITTSVSTPTGATTVTVVGTGVSATSSATFDLGVNAPSALRAAFYYPWFPQAWVQQGQNPFTNYVPTRGLYSIDVATVKAQIADMQKGNITLGIASWFGQGTGTDKAWPTLMQAAQGTGFGWAPYYEPEGISDPVPQQIASDLHYLWTTYHSPDGSNPVYLPGKGMVVFVYNADDPTQAKGCDTVDRWNQARQLLHDQFGETVYVDLKVFPGYRSCAGSTSINGWNQYGPASAKQDFSTAPGDGSYAISPGYWKSGAVYGTAPFLPRDRTRWQASIASMGASGAKWQLITTYNEWGEGTAIESSSGCRNPAPVGTYCDWSAGGSTSDFITDLHNAPVG